MKGKKVESVKLQPRDKILFEMLCHFGYLTVDLSQKRIFIGTNKKARKRLLKLEKSGFLKFVSRRERVVSRKVYIPNLANLVGVVPDEVLERGRRAVSMTPWFKAFNDHEDIVRDWAIRIQLLYPTVQVNLDFMHGNGSIAGAKFKKGGNGIFPDIVLSFGWRDAISFEIELSQKSDDRYIQKLTEILNIPGRSTIYVVKDSRLREIVLKNLDLILRSMKKRNIPIYSSVSVVIQNELKSEKELGNFIEEIRGQAWGRTAPGSSPTPTKVDSAVFCSPNEGLNLPASEKSTP